MEHKIFIRTAKISLILIYLVIFAGATVRMTGSGMGCPDWPKCFGYYIPPTNVEQLLWKPNHSYEKGQVIIVDEQLWVANKSFTSTDVYEENNWTQYTKHDYATFNVYHTWVEYINRLCGALAGVSCLIMFFLSFKYWKHKKSVVFWSAMVLFLLLYNAWLGKTVVDSVLDPYRITKHMIAALLNVAVLIYVIHIAQVRNYKARYDKRFQVVAWLSMLFTLFQIGLGTQVRQFVDLQTKAGITDATAWLLEVDESFYIHRTLSYVLVFVNLYLFIRNHRLRLGLNKINWVMILLLLEITTGILMYYFHFPFGTQAAHLVLASLLFGIQFSLLFDSNRKDKIVSHV